VRLLSDRGSVEIRPGCGGLFVANPNPVVRLWHTLLTVRQEASTVADAIAVREALEPVITADEAIAAGDVPRTAAATERHSGLDSAGNLASDSRGLPMSVLAYQSTRVDANAY
jgi:hypothetical protein